MKQLTNLLKNEQLSKIYVMGSHFLVLISNYLLHIIIARFFLSVEEYANYTLLIYLFNITNVFLLTGAPTVIALYYFGKDREQKLKTLFIIQTVIGLLLSIIFLAFSNQINNLIGAEGLAQILPLIAISFIPYSIFAYFGYISNAGEDYNLTTTTNLIFVIVRIAATLLLIEHLGLYSIVLAGIIAPLFSAIPRITRNLEIIKKIINVPASREWWKLSVESLMLGLFGLFVNLGLVIDLFLISRAGMSDYDLGHYSLFSTLARVPFYVTMGAMGFIWTDLNKSGDIKSKERYMIKAVLSISLFSIIWNICLISGYSFWGELLFDKTVEISFRLMLFISIFTTIYSLFYVLLNYLNSLSNRYVPLLIFFCFFIVSFAISVRSENNFSYIVLGVGISAFISLLLSFIYIFLNRKPIHKNE